MERWNGILRVPLYSNIRDTYSIGASLCISSSKTVSVPYANVIFFNGDRVQGTGNPVIDRLSDLQRIAETLVSKFGNSINAWVVEASTFNGPFAVYNDFIPSVNQLGEPKSYDPTGFPASTSTVILLLNTLKEVKKIIALRQNELHHNKLSASVSCLPKTVILGFSKGGTVLNQLIAELGFSETKSTRTPTHVNQLLMNVGSANIQEEQWIVPTSKECLLNSITEIHYVDVGLNSAGAYLTDPNMIEKVSARFMQEASGIRFVVHGTPRQWSDKTRVLIREEKDTLVQLIQSEAQRTGGKLSICERYYFADRPPDLQMHFEVIECLDVS